MAKKRSHSAKTCRIYLEQDEYIDKLLYVLLCLTFKGEDENQLAVKFSETARNIWGKDKYSHEEFCKAGNKKKNDAELVREVIQIYLETGKPLFVCAKEVANAYPEDCTVRSAAVRLNQKAKEFLSRPPLTVFSELSKSPSNMTEKQKKKLDKARDKHIKTLLSYIEKQLRQERVEIGGIE